MAHRHEQTTGPTALFTAGETGTEYSFMEALSLSPKHSISVASTELPVTAGGNLHDSVTTPSSPSTMQTSTNGRPGAPKSVPRSVASAAATKLQSQCLEICSKTTKLGDHIAVRMLEHLAGAKEHARRAVDDLAHGFLDTCQVLFAVQAGLGDCSRAAQIFPIDVLSELEKKFRVIQTEFHMLDQMLGKMLEHQRKGAMGRMMRGWGKGVSEHDMEKMTFALSRVRESLRLSALMFRWTLGSDKMDCGMGIGYTGLAAALDRLDQGPAHTRTSYPEPAGTVLSQTSLAGTAFPRQMSEVQQPPLPPIPSHQWAERSSSMHNDLPMASAGPPVDVRTTIGTASAGTGSSIFSADRVHSVTTNAFGRVGSFDGATSASGLSEPDGLLEEIAGIDLSSSKVVHLKANRSSVSYRAPRGQVNMDVATAKATLISAVRSRNHTLAEQLLDRGVHPNTGADMHALNDALRALDNQMVGLLLSFGADPNHPDQNGVTPLLAAANIVFLEGATTLLRYGADPNVAVPGGSLETPLITSIKANKIGFSHLLLAYGGDVQQTTSDGNTLVIAAINKKTPRKLLDLILDYGADPDGKSREGKTALFEAIQCARSDLVTSLLDHGANPNLPGPKHMLWPATYQPQCLKVLLARGADSKKAPGVVELATSLNSIDSVRILLDAGVDLNAKKDGVYTPLCTSIRDNRHDIFQLLLSSGANPNLMASEYPLWKCITHKRVHFMQQLVTAGASLTSPKGIVEQAVSSDNMEALRWLLEQQRVSPNEKSAAGNTPLTTAIRENRGEMVDMLLSWGADPNMRGQDWPVCMAVRNPAILKRLLSVLAEPRAYKGVMEMAVTANQLESVKMLIGAGVSVEDRNGGVFSPLTTAIREDHEDIVEYLINDGGADINAPGEHLPIVKAVRRYHGDTTMMKMLLDRGADPNKLYRGWNAIMQTVEMGDIEVLKLLSGKSGVDVDVKDELGRTVVEMAASRGWEEAVSIMLKKR